MHFWSAIDSTEMIHLIALGTLTPSNCADSTWREKRVRLLWLRVVKVNPALERTVWTGEQNPMLGVAISIHVL